MNFFSENRNFFFFFLMYFSVLMEEETVVSFKSYCTGEHVSCCSILSWYYIYNFTLLKLCWGSHVMWYWYTSNLYPNLYLHKINIIKWFSYKFIFLVFPQIQVPVWKDLLLKHHYLPVVVCLVVHQTFCKSWHYYWEIGVCIFFKVVWVGGLCARAS